MTQLPHKNVKSIQFEKGIVQSPNLSLFHGSLIQNWGRIGPIVLCMNNGGGSGAKARKDIRQGDGRVGGYKKKKPKKTRPFRATNMPLPPPPNQKPLPISRENTLQTHGRGFYAKEAQMMVLSAFIALNILIGASPVLFVTFQRLISSHGIFWPV